MGVFLDNGEIAAYLHRVKIPHATKIKQQIVNGLFDSITDERYDSHH